MHFFAAVTPEELLQGGKIAYFEGWRPPETVASRLGE
jgi:hypothetical protein